MATNRKPSTSIKLFFPSKEDRVELFWALFWFKMLHLQRKEMTEKENTQKQHNRVDRTDLGSNPDFATF